MHSYRDIVSFEVEGTVVAMKANYLQYIDEFSQLSLMGQSLYAINTDGSAHTIPLIGRVYSFEESVDTEQSDC